MTAVTAPDPLNMPEEKTLELLEAAKSAGDSFMVRIFRKRPGVSSPGLGENFAVFAETTLEQISSPEGWVQRLGGGGLYCMTVSHTGNTAKRIGGLIRFQVPGPSRDANTQVTREADWDGPRVMTYPTAAGVNPAAVAAAAAQTQRQQQWGWPDVPQGTFPIGFQQTQMAPGVPADSVFQREQAANERIRAAEKALADKEAALQKQMMEREENVRRADLEARMRAENERVRAEAAQHARSLEDKLNRMLEMQSVPKDNGIDKTITAVAAVVTPLITQMMASSQAAREASDRRSAEQNAQMQNLMTTLLTKKEGLPPEITMLFEMQKNQSTGNAEMMTRIVDAMGATTKSAVQMIEVIADMSSGPEESPAIQMVKEAVRGISMLANGAKDGARKQIQAQTQPPRLPQQPAQQPQQNAPVQNGGQNGQRPAQQQVPVTQFNGYQPGQKPQQQGQGAVATGPQQPAETPNGLREPERNSVEEMERLIRNRYEPVENVAAFFVASVKAPEPNVMKQALREFDGEIGDLLEDRLGNWIHESTQNMGYIQRLAEAVETAGVAAGIYAPDDDSESGDQEPLVDVTNEPQPQP